MAKRNPRNTARPPSPRRDVVLCDQRIEAAYSVPDLKAAVSGPWTREFEKIAWTDPATGFPCIIRRLEQGCLAGYVAVPRGHALFGFSADAVPVRAHGGIDHAAPCEIDEPEETSVCHVRHDAIRQDDEAWWFGFTCNQDGDLVPGDPMHENRAESLGIGQVYRTERFVFDQCTSLALRLAEAGAQR